MVDILPFKGIRYNPNNLNISDVVAPPYDVISDEERDELHGRHENNIIRLILGKGYATDDDTDNKYTRAKQAFEDWLEEGILMEDPESSFYVYEEEYTVNGERKRMRGFIGLARLVEFDKGEILPHEETLSGPKADRLKLRRTTGANFSQIFTFYSDPDSIIEGLLNPTSEPEAELKDGNGVIHRLWRVNDQAVVGKVVELMKGKKLFIADGHHRYETALALRDELKQAGYDYVMMYFTNMDSGGLSILPAHRIVTNIDYDKSRFFHGLERFFLVEEVEKDGEGGMEKMFEKMKEANSKHIFGLFLEGKYYTLTLKDPAVMDERIKDRSQAWRRLDVTILHTLVLGDILGIEEDERHIRYEIDGSKAVKMAWQMGVQMVFFLNPTKVKQVRDVALAGERMPGKATYFYPKLLSGLVMRKIE
jgi:uncharacterized protein (DUF1015 family)